MYISLVTLDISIWLEKYSIVLIFIHAKLFTLLYKIISIEHYQNTLDRYIVSIFLMTLEYTIHKCGKDILDQFKRSYSYQRMTHPKTLKCWHCEFFFVLDMTSIWNIYWLCTKEEEALHQHVLHMKRFE